MRRHVSLLSLLSGLIVLTAAAAPTATEGPAHARVGVPFTAEDILRVATISVLDMTDEGRLVAATTRRVADNAEVDNVRYGDPTYVSPARVQLLVVDTQRGTSQSIFRNPVNVRQAVWSHDGRRLAILLADNAPGPRITAAVEPPKGNPTPTAGAGRKTEPRTPTTADPPAPVTVLCVWDVQAARVTEVPRRPETTISLNSGLDWTPDDKRVVVTLRPSGWDKAARDRFDAVTTGPVIVHSSKEPFLEWDDLQRAVRRRILAEVDPATGEATRLLPETKISSYSLARDGSFVTFMQDVTEKTDYDEIGGTANILKIVQRQPGAAPRTIAEGEELKGVQLRWSDDGRAFAYARKGEVFVQGVDEAAPRSLTPQPPEEKNKDARKADQPKDPAGTAAEKKAVRESFSVARFSRDGKRLLIISKKGWYIVGVADARRERIVELDEENEEKNPQMEAVEWSPDGQAIYLTYSERDRWDRGLMRLEVATKAMTPLAKDSRLYSNFRMSRDGSTFVFAASDGDLPAELYVAGADFKSMKKLTDANSWMADRSVPTSELVAYRDTDGKQMYGVLRYPVDYVKGRKVPTVFEIYETFFDNGFNGRAAFLTNHGYAVFHPSVNLVIGQPGEAWVKGVTAAANRLIEMGIADPDRLGVHGTSYGGYATCLLITQTDRFKAAINISGKVDMVSFYTDSPRLGVRNIHAPEKSQDRLGATLWEHPERYLEHSAILRADRVKTPLLCITGDQDPNVPASQSREMYYALRRLGKEVEWVRYVNGAHRPPNGVAESIDFEQRILAWYDKYLRAEAGKTAATDR
jgi:dipeptidyl aminopeptidase/acylaminoacyl peptidase